MTAKLIKKGQSVDKTREAFRLLRENGVHPMPMMMHHDEQPLISFGPRPYGLLNQVRLLRKRLADREMELTLTDAAKDQLAEDGYDPVYGARPLKRVIQQKLENPLAQKILTGEITDPRKGA